MVTKAADSLHGVLPSDFQNEVQGRVVDISSLENIDALWDKFRGENINVDVVVLNAASFPKVAPILELGTEILLETISSMCWPGIVCAEIVHAEPGSQESMFFTSTASMTTWDFAG